MVGSAKDPQKRFATLHFTFRVVGANEIEPLIIFANGNPNKEDPWEMPKGLQSKKHESNGKKGTEKELYHPKAKVVFQENAWLDEDISKHYFDWVCLILEDYRDKWDEDHPDFPFEPKVLIQQDNLRGQNTFPIKLTAMANDVFIWNTLENCTDAVAWLDQWVLWDLKCGVDRLFWADFESSAEKTAYYSNPVSHGGITLAQWRISITHWVMQVLEQTRKKSVQLLKTARKVGLANCRCGCENHYISVGKISTYTVGKQNDPLMNPLSEEDAQNLVAAEKAERARVRRARRSKISAGQKLAKRMKKN